MTRIAAIALAAALAAPLSAAAQTEDELYAQAVACLGSEAAVEAQLTSQDSAGDRITRLRALATC